MSFTFTEQLAAAKNFSAPEYKTVMVHEITKGETEYYKCEECGLLYADQEIAEKCQAWCAEHQSCNIEIISHAEENKPKGNKYDL